MRLIGGASLIVILATVSAVSGIRSRAQTGAVTDTVSAQANSNAGRHEGKTIFRYDTFGDEQFWTDVLRMHEVIPNVDPETALAVGLKVDVEALPRQLVAKLQAKDLDLQDPAVTVELLRLNAVVGIKGTVNDAGQLTTRNLWRRNH